MRVLSEMISGCSVALLTCVWDKAVVWNRIATHVAERVGSYWVWGISYPEDPSSVSHIS
jgi:hypothetical protein